MAMRGHWWWVDGHGLDALEGKSSREYDTVNEHGEGRSEDVCLLV